MPTESIVGAANWVARQRANGKQVELTGESVAMMIEPPSAVAAAAVVTGHRSRVLTFPAPDLRRPLVDGAAHTVWRYQGDLARPAQPAPAPEATELTRTVANLAWTSPIAVYRLAARFADTPLPDLLGLLCHVPPAPDNMRWQNLLAVTPTYWPRLAQPWICVGILHHRPDEPWATSTRRQVLVDLAFGIEDWTTDAALFALVVAAWMEPAARPDVRELVRRRLDAARTTSRRRFMSIAPSIAELMLVTPEASADDRRTARRLLRALDSKGSLLSRVRAKLRRRPAR
jgi:hypothetical protein